MSQLPLTGQSGPMSGIRVREPAAIAGSTIPRIGRTESLDVFGVPPLPMVERGSQQAQALMRALGMADLALSRSAEAVARQRAEQERIDREAEALHRGAAADRTLEVGPQLLADIREGRVAPVEGEDAASFARRVIGERAAFADDDAEAYRDEVYERMLEPVQNATLARTRVIRERTTEEMINLTVSGATGKDAESLRTAAAKVREINPDISEQAATELVATTSLQWAAVQGDTEAFEAAASVLPENSVDAAKARVTLNERIRVNEREKVDAFQNEIAGLYVDELPTSYIRERIGARRGQVPDEAIENAIYTLDIREERGRREALEQALDQYNQTQASAVLESDTTTALTAFYHNGLAGLDGDYEWVDPAGKTQRITREERIEAGINGAFARIDAEGRTPEDAFAQKMQVLGNNGATYKPWSRVMEAGTAAIFQSVRTARKPGEEIALPANAADGYALWKQMNATNENVLQMHVSERTNDLYWLASLAERQGRDPAQALILAATAQASTPFGTLSDEMVVKNDDWFMEGENAQEIGALIAGTARLAVGAGLANPEQAIKDASRQIKASHRKVNGSWIDIRNRAIPPTFDLDAERVIEEWMISHGETSGVPRSRLTLVPAQSGSGWWVWDKRANLPVDTDWFVSDADLARAGGRRIAALRDSVTGDPFRELKAVVKKTAADTTMTQLFGSPEARAMVRGAAGALGDAMANAPLGPGQNFTAGDIPEGIDRAKLAATVAVGGAAGRTVAGVTSWLNRRPNETEAQYAARTGRKP